VYLANNNTVCTGYSVNSTLSSVTVNAQPTVWMFPVVLQVQRVILFCKTLVHNQYVWSRGCATSLVNWAKLLSWRLWNLLTLHTHLHYWWLR